MKTLLRSVFVVAVVGVIVYFVMKWCGLLGSLWIWLMIAHFGLFSSIMRFARGTNPLPNALQTVGDLVFLILVVLSIFVGVGEWWHGLVGYLLANLAGAAVSAIVVNNEGAQVIQIVLTLAGVVAVPILCGWSAYLLFFA